MMGADEIIQKIEERANAEVDTIIAAADSKRKEILDEAKADAERRKQAILEKGEKDAILEKQRILADANLKARRLRWDVQEELIDQVLDATKDEVNKIRNSPRYTDILKGLIQEAVWSIGADKLEVTLSEGDTIDLDAISGEGGAKLSLSDERVTGMGGVVLRTLDGRIEVDNTFDKRMDRFSEVLRTEITTTLFGGA